MKTETITQNIWNTSLDPIATFSHSRYQSCHQTYLSCIFIIRRHTCIQSLVNMMFSEHFMGNEGEGIDHLLELSGNCRKQFSKFGGGHLTNQRYILSPVYGFLLSISFLYFVGAIYTQSTLKSTLPKGTWVAQLVEHPPLGFGSGHDLRVMESILSLLSTLSAVCFRYSLPLPLLTHVLSLK